MTAEFNSDLLSQFGIRPTPVRTLIYRALLNSELPMSGLELEMTLDTVDRSSITRTLALFQKQGIVRTIDDGSGAARYELINGSAGNTHPHFHCRMCRRTFCLDVIPSPSPHMPDGYEVESINITIRGLCPECAHKALH